jgi:hypothetical protein
VKTVDYLAHVAIPAAYALLPPAMSSREATAMLIAIALQESKATYREQINGPAHGFYQFEKGTLETRGGITGLMMHRLSKPHLRLACETLRYPMAATSLYDAVTHNDVLATICARLLLYTLPAPLPDRFQVQESWRQYIAGWRPGKPHIETWQGHYETAWGKVEA